MLKSAFRKKNMCKNLKNRFSMDPGSGSGLYSGGLTLEHSTEV